MNLGLSDAPFRFLEDYALWFVFWSAFFSVLGVARIVRHYAYQQPAQADGPIATELAGLPLTFSHVVAFYIAVSVSDWASALVFLWWGPGFVAIVLLYLWYRQRKKKIDWYPWRIPISWACKLNYWAIVLIMIAKGMWVMVFAYSVWIVNDQVIRLFLADDADRLRRSFDDRWLLRLAYPLGLLIPLFVAIPQRGMCIFYASVLLTLWGTGVVLVIRRGKLHQRPEDTELLRNMIYFKPSNER